MTRTAVLSSEALPAVTADELRGYDMMYVDRPPRDDALWPAWGPTARRLFKTGFVPTRLAAPAGTVTDRITFVRSSRLADVKLAGIESEDTVAMSQLGHYGRFGNQLFQYAFLKMYSLYTATAPALPAWLGEAEFGLVEPRPVAKTLPSLAFMPFDDDDLGLWTMETSPVNVDFHGFFQEIPAAWAPHRAFLRALFTMVDAFRLPLQASLDRLRNDRRTLVAIHIRRGDYLRQDHARTPWFRCVPLELYHDLLAALWPTLSRPLLYVASDDPTIAQSFAAYPQVGPADPSLAQVPAHLRDFFHLSAADILALCNSSFSRMAALLADDTQRCFLPSFDPPGFAPYEPWSDRAFWQRFNGPGAIGIGGSGIDASRRRGIYLRQMIGILGLEPTANAERVERLQALRRSYSG